MNYLEIAGTLIGLLYLWFEYKASIWLWPVSVIMPAIYIVIYYQVGLYADSAISIYYLLAGIYGWGMWLRHTPDKGEKPVSGTPSKLLLPMFVVLLVVFVLIGIILKTYTDSTVPWWDSLTTSLSIIAMWMLAHKYVEQWLVWLVVDIVSCGIYIYKVTTKKRNAERYSDRIELQGFQSCFRLFVKPSQSPLKPNQDAATLLVRNHARNGDKRTRITKQGVKD